MGHHKYPAGIDDKTGGLTDKAEVFCAEYINNGGNALAAARIAGYNPKSSMGSKLLKTPEVLARIDELRTDVAQRHSLKAGAVRSELTKIAFSNLTDVADCDGEVVKPRPFDTLDEFGQASLSKVDGSEETRRVGKEEITTRKVSVAQHDKVKALIALGRMLGEVEVSHKKSTEGVPMGSCIDASRLTPEERETFRTLLQKLKGDPDE